MLYLVGYLQWVLVRHDLNRLLHLDRQTATPIRRYERKRPGELVHVDIKKLGRIPKGRGGHEVHGRAATRRDKRHGVGYAYLHTAIDDHSRLATPKSSPTRQAPPLPLSGAEPRPGSPPTASLSSGS